MPLLLCPSVPVFKTMPPKRKRNKGIKKKYHIILILLLIIAGVFFVIDEFGKEKTPDSFFDRLRPLKKPDIRRPESRRAVKLPKVAIVIDDLGTNKQQAEKIISIKSPLTFSVLPQERYSSWIAQEGERLGRDIIVHLPMEATRPLKLGAGGLYTWMDDDEIRETVQADIRSVPHIIGASNHMGSAFTKDKRAMLVVLSTLKKQRLFFFDSLTTAESVGYALAKTKGLVTLRRDVFLDDTDSLREIGIQWKRLVTIARKKGSAIAIGHPKDNTIQFLQTALANNKDFTVVPISELIPKQ